jgi:hypothetical protein
LYQGGKRSQEIFGPGEDDRLRGTDAIENKEEMESQERVVGV